MRRCWKVVHWWDYLEFEQRELRDSWHHEYLLELVTMIEWRTLEWLGCQSSCLLSQSSLRTAACRYTGGWSSSRRRRRGRWGWWRPSTTPAATTSSWLSAVRSLLRVKFYHHMTQLIKVSLNLIFFTGGFVCFILYSFYCFYIFWVFLRVLVSLDSSQTLHTGNKMFRSKLTFNNSLFSSKLRRMILKVMPGNY